MRELSEARGTGATTAISVTTRHVLWGGVVAGPFFYVMVLIQMSTRSGFDIRRHPLSLLSLGELGWIQIATFVLTGLAGIACAVGMRQALRHGRGGTSGPELVGLWGLGLIAAGAFHPDPSLGFPPATAQAMPGSTQLARHPARRCLFHIVRLTGRGMPCVRPPIRRAQAVELDGLLHRD